MDNSHRIRQNPSSGARRFIITLLVTYALLIVYGTLFPMGNWQSPAISPFTLMLQHELRHTSPSDILTNILVYMPLGVLIILAFRRRYCPVCKLLVATLASALLSFSLELSLIHISEPTRPNAPSRMPSSA